MGILSIGNLKRPYKILLVIVVLFTIILAIMPVINMIVFFSMLGVYIFSITTTVIALYIKFKREDMRNARSVAENQKIDWSKLYPGPIFKPEPKIPSKPLYTHTYLEDLFNRALRADGPADRMKLMIEYYDKSNLPEEAEVWKRRLKEFNREIEDVAYEDTEDKKHRWISALMPRSKPGEDKEKYAISKINLQIENTKKKINKLNKQLRGFKASNFIDEKEAIEDSIDMEEQNLKYLMDDLKEHQETLNKIRA